MVIVQKKLLKVIFQKIKEFIKEELYDKFKFHKKLDKAVPVIVYQMGKVGSSSIYHPLKKAYHGVVAHTHQFNQNAWYWEVRKLHELFYSGKQKKFKIISLMREPVGRNVSEFFHRFTQYAGIPIKESTLSLEEIKVRFLDNLDHDFPLDWFDKNFKLHFEIDVYKKPFGEQGFSFYETENIQILLMKHDLSDKKKEALVNNFLGINRFKIQVRNVGDKKDYSATYKKFKSEVNLPNWYLQKMYDSKYYKHFYK